ncbi:FAD-dependent oxidoreductase [Verrucomicrobia bacterium LW23]|nr:FAD-dependent oxidoreductase [Verrucomicrobia bacterium LW23]
MTIGSRFQPDIVEKRYDVIVIGSGISGLTVASFQARQGRSVLVLEKHYTAGGATHTYRRRGFEGDSGLHYLGQVHDKGNGLRKIFDFISGEQLSFAPMADEYDRLVYPDKSYSLRAGPENFREELERHFPAERRAIAAYLKLLPSVSKALEYRAMRKGLPPALGFFAGLFEKKRYFAASTFSVLRSLTSDERLISVLAGQWGDYGLPPKRSSFGAHAAVAHHYLSGGSFPRGGSSEVARTIVASIEANGGKVVVNKGVARVLVRKGVAVGVELESGETILGKKVVSSAGILNTYHRLVDREWVPPRVADKISRLRPSLSFLTLTLGIRRDASCLSSHPGGNLWVHPGYNHDENLARYLRDPRGNPPPLCYIGFPSLKDPTWKDRMGETTVIHVMGVADYAWFKPWIGTKAGERGDDYMEAKEALTRPYRATLYRMFPQLEGQAAFQETSSPLTVDSYLNTRSGEQYGLEYSSERFQDDWIAPRTSIRGFYLTGQDTLMNGIAGAMMSGVVTSMAMEPWATCSQLRAIRYL